MKKLGLINYEGDCISAIKRDNYFMDIVDQYGKSCGVFTVEDLYGFIDGLINVVDSKGKSWNFPSEHRDARPSYSRIHNFVKYFTFSEREVNDAFVKGWELRHLGMSDELIIHEFVIFLDKIAEERETRKNK
jgi:hypothetical protein